MKGKPKIWTIVELDQLTLLFPVTWNKELAKQFNCGWRTVVRKARELNLEKSESFRDSIDFSSFGKGNEPWNKGIKGLPMVPECVAKQFKKGNPSVMKDPAVAQRVRTRRNETIRIEKLRIKNDLPQKTKLKIVNYYTV